MADGSGEKRRVDWAKQQLDGIRGKHRSGAKQMINARAQPEAGVQQTEET